MSKQPAINPDTALTVIEKKWQHLGQEALLIWSNYLRLKKPVFCKKQEEEKKNGLISSFAMIRLTDLSIVLSVRQIQDYKLEEFALEIMAHEIGHHIYCPADLTDLARMIARIKRGLGDMDKQAGFVGNLYSDLLINNKLFFEHGLRMDRIFIAIKEKTEDPLWNFYTRIYEILWSLPKGTLTTIEIEDEMEADAVLGNRLIRHYAVDWLKGSGRFAALCYTYLLKRKDAFSDNRLNVWLDTGDAGVGDAFPVGLTEIEDDEINGAVHPALEEAGEESAAPQDEPGDKQSRGNYREPFEYGQILKSIGLNLDDKEIAIRYYKERAVKYVISFPVQIKETSKEPLPEGFSTWDIGSPLEKINWIESIVRSPYIVPGYTTVEQVYGTTEGSNPDKEPVDLDLYVDCSGSMPNPVCNVSYLTLAGAIIAISALRSGSRVQATLWSGTNQFTTTDGFISKEKPILGILTGYFGDGTAFPIHMLRDTYKNRKPTERKVHILVISDSGVTTMYDKDEQNNDGYDIAGRAYDTVRGGGTFVLQLWGWGDWKEVPLLEEASEQGWDIYRISDWEDLIGFSKALSG